MKISSYTEVMKKLFLAIFLSTAFYPTLARAEIYLKPALLYLRSKGSSPNASQTIIIDVAAGKLTDKNWVYGLIYQSDKSAIFQSPIADRTSYGISIGKVSAKDVGPFFIGHLFPYSVDGQKIYQGMGLQGDLGVKVALRKYALTVQLSYKYYSYKRSATAQFTGPEEISESRLDPMIGIFLRF